MGILNITTDLMGQSGLTPKLIYIDTNDLLSVVTSPGYLSGINDIGYSITEKSMAVVTYVTPGPIVVTEVALFDISFDANGDPILRQYGSLANSSWQTSGNTGLGGLLGTISADPWSIIAGSVSFATLDPSTSAFSVLAPNFELTAISSSVKPDVLYYDVATKRVTYGAAPGGGAAWLLSGNSFAPGQELGLTTAGTMTFRTALGPWMTIGTGKDLIVSVSQALFSVTTATGFTLDVVHPLSTLLIRGDGNVTIDATNDLLIESDNDIDIRTTGATKVINIDASVTNGSVDIRGNSSLECYVGGFRVTSPTFQDLIFAPTGFPALAIAPSNVTELVAIGHTTGTCSTKIFNEFQLPDILSATKPEVLYFDTTTKIVSYGAAPGGGAAWLLAGNSGNPIGSFVGTIDNQPLLLKTFNTTRLEIASGGSWTLSIAAYIANCTTYNLTATGAYQVTTSDAAGMVFTATTSAAPIRLNADNLDFQVGGTPVMSVLSTQATTLCATSPSLTIGNGTTVTTINGPLVMPNLPTATGGEKPVMFNTTTKQFFVSP